MLVVANVQLLLQFLFVAIYFLYSDVICVVFSSSYSSDSGRFYLLVIDVELRVASDHTQ
jgi:hypothetical protein